MNPVMQRLQAMMGGDPKRFQAMAAPLVVVAVLALMVLPLPPFLLDIFFTFNIATALMVMMVAATMLRPLDFAALPAADADDRHRSGRALVGDLGDIVLHTALAQMKFGALILILVVPGRPVLDAENAVLIATLAERLAVFFFVCQNPVFL